MNSLRFLIVLFLIIPIGLLAQISLDIDEAQSQKDTVRLIKETPNGTMIIELTDLKDLSNQRIDSLIRVLDSKTTIDSSNIYGHSLFRNKFEIVDKEIGKSIVKIPDSYILGFGDEISVSIFGTSQFLGKYTIDTKGFIYPEDIPSIYLFGMELGQAKEVIRKTFSRYFIFKRDQISISLGSPRDIQVNVFGEVKKPGSYNISALNTSFQALFNAGGPNKTGSVRNIKVITNGYESTLDVYKLMSDPLSNVDLAISDNTLINVPVAQKVVRIEGAIRRPMSYELKDMEGLKELFHFAGGLRPKAYLKSLSIQRYDVDRMRIIDLNLQELLTSSKNYPLQNGDIIRVKTISNVLDDVVRISGAVKHPGPYELKSTPRIADLLKRAELSREARIDNIYIKRNNANGTTSIITVNGTAALTDPSATANYSLENKDEVVVDSLSLFTDKYTVKVSGAVRREIVHSYDASGKMTVRSALNLAGGTLKDASEQAYILRTDPRNRTEKEYIRFNVAEILNSSSGKADLVLLPEDELIILSTTASDDVKLVTVSGAVRIDTTLQYAANMEVRDALLLAGGLVQQASGHIDIYRTTYDDSSAEFRTQVLSVQVDSDYNLISSKQIRLMAGDKLVARTIDDFTEQAFVYLEGEINQVGKFALINNNEQVSDLIARAGGLTKEAFRAGAYIKRDTSSFLVLDLVEVLNNKQSSSNYFLSENDTLVVPKQENLVYIDTKNSRAAEVYPAEYENRVIGVPYVSGKNGKWYLEEYSGGPASFADGSEVIVKSSNGPIAKSRKIAWLYNRHPQVSLGAIISYGRKENYHQDGAKVNMKDKAYPKLRKGVIINIDKEGRLTEKEDQLESGNSQNEPRL